MTTESKTFSENLMHKLEKLFAENRNTGDVNYNLSARVKLNLSVQEVDYIAYLIRNDLKTNG